MIPRLNFRRAGFPVGVHVFVICLAELKARPEATLVDAICELEFRQAVEEGLAELDRGEGIPIEPVKAKIAAWAGR